jgi:hypothetical protein
VQNKNSNYPNTKWDFAQYANRWQQSFIEIEPVFIVQVYYKLVTPLALLIQSRYYMLGFGYTYESLFKDTRVSFDEGKQIKGAEDHNGEFRKIFNPKMRITNLSPCAV